VRKGVASAVASKFLEAVERGLSGKLTLPLLMVAAGAIGDEASGSSG
jgi:hypothetical protein